MSLAGTQPLYAIFQQMKINPVRFRDKQKDHCSQSLDLARRLFWKFLSELAGRVFSTHTSRCTLETAVVWSGLWLQKRNLLLSFWEMIVPMYRINFGSNQPLFIRTSRTHATYFFDISGSCSAICNMNTLGKKQA